MNLPKFLLHSSLSLSTITKKIFGFNNCIYYPSQSSLTCPKFLFRFLFCFSFIYAILLCILISTYQNLFLNFYSNDLTLRVIRFFIIKTLEKSNVHMQHLCFKFEWEWKAKKLMGKDINKPPEIYAKFSLTSYSSD